jgi:hypothetical protein
MLTYIISPTALVYYNLLHVPCFLIYKLLHHFDAVPDISLNNIKGREAQLFKPLLKIFQGTKSFEELRKVVWEYVKERREVKVDTFHVRVHDSVIELIARCNSVELEIIDICSTVIENTSSEPVPNHPKTYTSEEFGDITVAEIRNICIQVLEAKPSTHRHTSRKLIFNLENLKQFEQSFSFAETDKEITLGNQTTLDRFGGDRGDAGDRLKEYTY